MDTGTTTVHCTKPGNYKLMSYYFIRHHAYESRTFVSYDAPISIECCKKVSLGLSWVGCCVVMHEHGDQLPGKVEKGQENIRDSRRSWES